MTPLDTLKAVVERAKAGADYRFGDDGAEAMTGLRILAFLTSDTAVEELAREVDPRAWEEARRLMGLEWKGRAAPATGRALEVIGPSLGIATSILSLIASKGLAE